MTSQIEILFVSANAPSPVHRQRIRPEVEFRDIRRRLQAGKHGRFFRLLPPLFATRIDDLQEDLSYYQPHVVHFAGHAGPFGIELEDQHGQVITVDMQSLTRLFAAVNRPAFGSDGNRVKLIVLHACNTSDHAEKLTEVADFTIGTSAEVWDKNSNDFAPAFYGSLANGQSIDAALESALAVTRMKNFPGNHDLRLFKSEGADPSMSFVAHVLGDPAADGKSPRAFGDRPPSRDGRKGGGSGKVVRSQPASGARKSGAPGKSAVRWEIYADEEERRRIELEKAVNEQRK